VKGLYDSSKTLQENVNLSDPILSRFDIVCIIKDMVDPEADNKLAEFVIDSHVRNSKLYKDLDIECQFGYDVKSSLMRKYIRYARIQIKPRLHKSEDELIAKLYVELRKISTRNAGMPISVRHLESIIRIAEAHARIYLREYVSNNDVSLAIKVGLELLDAKASIIK